MSRFIFIQIDNETGRSNEVKVGHDTHTWMELQDEFFMFLQGCGFVIDREDIAEYWSDYLPAAEAQPEDNWDFGLDIGGGADYTFNDDVDFGGIEINVTAGK